MQDLNSLGGSERGCGGLSFLHYLRPEDPPTVCADISWLGSWTEERKGLERQHAFNLVPPLWMQGNEPLQVLTALTQCPLNCEISPFPRSHFGGRISSQRQEKKQDSWSVPSLRGGLGRESARIDWNPPLWSQQEGFARQTSLPFTHRQGQSSRGFLLTSFLPHTFQVTPSSVSTCGRGGNQGKNGAFSSHH